MNSKSIYEAIKRTVLACMPHSRVLLFGSRARGDHDKHSDYDLLIISPNLLTDREKIEWSTKIDNALVHDVHIPVDVLVFSEDEVLKKREWPGHIIRSAMREGIVL